MLILCENLSIYEKPYLTGAVAKIPCSGGLSEI
jgi:hypothetical protein